jgi:hypothetical protein
MSPRLTSGERHRSRLAVVLVPSRWDPTLARSGQRVTRNKGPAGDKW